MLETLDFAFYIGSIHNELFLFRYIYSRCVRTQMSVLMAVYIHRRGIDKNELKLVCMNGKYT